MNPTPIFVQTVDSHSTNPKETPINARTSGTKIEMHAVSICSILVCLQDLSSTHVKPRSRQATTLCLNPPPYPLLNFCLDNQEQQPELHQDQLVCSRFSSIFLY